MDGTDTLVSYHMKTVAWEDLGLTLDLPNMEQFMYVFFYVLGTISCCHRRGSVELREHKNT
jgi:hypothetical protein